VRIPEGLVLPHNFPNNCFDVWGRRYSRFTKNRGQGWVFLAPNKDPAQILGSATWEKGLISGAYLETRVCLMRSVYRTCRTFYTHRYIKVVLSLSQTMSLLREYNLRRDKKRVFAQVQSSHQKPVIAHNVVFWLWRLFCRLSRIQLWEFWLLGVLIRNHCIRKTPNADLGSLRGFKRTAAQIFNALRAFFPLKIPTRARTNLNLNLEA